MLMRPEGDLHWSVPKVGKESFFSVFYGGEEAVFLSAPLEAHIFTLV